MNTPSLQPETAVLTPPDPRVKRRSLAIIFFIMLLDVVGIMILAPVAPYIAARYSSDAITVTLFTAIYAAGQFFAAPALGKLGDRYGRRSVLLVSIFGSVIGYLIFGFGGALWVLFLSRVIDGITGGNMSVAGAAIIDISPPHERAKNLALIGLAWSVGLIVGPALGGIFGQISLEAPAFAAAGLSFIGLLLVYFLLPESLPANKRRTASIRASDFNPLQSIGEMARKPQVGLILLALCLFHLGFNGINSTESIFMIDKFAAQSWQISLQLVLLGLALLLTQAFLVGKFVTRFGDRAVAIGALCGLAVTALITFFVPIFWLVYPFMMLKTAASAFVFPTLSAMGTERVSDADQGQLMGVTTAVGSMTSIIAPITAGILYDQVRIGAPYWFGAIMFIGAALMLTRLRQAFTAPQPA